ncbi:hypothetical protein Godav_003663, partial [Gossypium davidsonii]|nr:hypothetical protein [Gossypium davidsonii]
MKGILTRTQTTKKKLKPISNGSLRL